MTASVAGTGLNCQQEARLGKGNLRFRVTVGACESDALCDFHDEYLIPATAAEDTLNLSVVVKCFSDPSIPVNPCQKCRDREEARVQRNLANRISRNNSTPDRSEDSLTNPPSSAIKGKSVARAQDAGGGSGIVVFNCAEYQCFRDGRVVLPLRVTCYSRHHNEKVGFQYANLLRTKPATLIF